jgi:ABC-2 type transport system permease protein
MSWQRILGVFFRYYYVLKKGPHQLIDLFYWPFIDILLWGLTSVWIENQNPNNNLPLVLLTALIFWHIAWRGSVDIALNLLQEFWQRNLINLFSTPLKVIEWILGVLLLSSYKLLLTMFFGIGTVYVLYALNVLTIGWAFIPFAALLLIFGWSLSFICSSFIIYWGHKVETATWVIAYLFAPFSGVFYPVSMLPSWAQTLSWCLPTTYIFEGMRQLLATKVFPMKYFWISCSLNIGLLSLSIAGFYFAYEASRKKGLARLE